MSEKRKLNKTDKKQKRLILEKADNRNVKQRYKIAAVKKLKEARKVESSKAASASAAPKEINANEVKKNRTVNSAVTAQRHSDNINNSHGSSHKAHSETTTASHDEKKNFTVDNIKTAAKIKQITQKKAERTKRAQQLAGANTYRSDISTPAGNTAAAREEAKFHTADNVRTSAPSAPTEAQKAKAAELSRRLGGMTSAHISESASSLENKMKHYAVGQAEMSAKKAVHESANGKKMNIYLRTSPEYMEKKIKEAVQSDKKYAKLSANASKHFKKSCAQDKKAEGYRKKYEKASHKAEKRRRTADNLIGAANAVNMAVSSDPEKAAAKAAVDAARRTRLGNQIFNIANTGKNIAEAVDDPEQAAKDIAAYQIEKTIKSAFTGENKAKKIKRKAEKAERKSMREQQKGWRANRQANRAKEAAINKAKVQFYQEKKGLVASNTFSGELHQAAQIFGGKRNILKLFSAVEESAVTALIPVIAVAFALLMLGGIITAMFSWLTPHSDTQYDEANNEWISVDLESEEEVMRGYVKHISDYFDKKQIEILKIVNLDFGGFEPDKYTYNHYEERGGGGDIIDPYITYEIKTVSYKVIERPDPTVGREVSPAGVPRPLAGRTFSAYYEYFYKTNSSGVAKKCTSAEAEYSRIMAARSINIEAYYAALREKTKIPPAYPGGRPTYTIPLYTFDNGRIYSGEDITERVIKQYDESGALVFSGNAVDFIRAHPEMLYYESYDFGLEGMYTVGEHTWETESNIVSQQDDLFEPDNYIWNLYEYRNEWIKLSDELDFEHIIALAAAKKWQDIEAEGFDYTTYSFEITDDDLDYCIDELYNFSYGYRFAPCRNRNCNRYMTRWGWRYECNRPNHRHLIGEVVNFSLSGGIDMALAKVLSIPKPEDYPTTEEYNSALSKYETDKAIYEAYYEYIYYILGTSTKLPDYENDADARTRLYNMYLAEGGKRPSNPPTNVTASSGPARAQISEYSTVEKVEYDIVVSWMAPAREEYARGRYVEITGYNVYMYNGRRYTHVGTVSGSETSFNFTLTIDGWRGYSENYAFVVEAFNDAGKSPKSAPSPFSYYIGPYDYRP